MRKKILLKGPLLTRSGYGEQARFALRALRSREDLFDIYIQPLQWGKTSWMNEITPERQWIDKTIEKTIHHLQQQGTFDVSLQVTIPNEWERLAPINIGYTAGIETTAVDPSWLIKSNEVIDRIVVVSNHSKNTFINSVYNAEHPDGSETQLRLEKPIESVNYPVKHYEELPDLELDLKTDFNFVVVAQYGPRKNIQNTIKWFMEEFKEEEVGLVLKTNMMKNCHMDRVQLHHEMKMFIASFSKDHKCKVYLLHGDMTDEEIHSLYLHPKISAFLTLAHGEGFGLPIFEAAYSGLPVVATGWSGQLDFLIDSDKNEEFYNVAFDIQPIPKEVVWEGVIREGTMWAYPREQSAKEKMRQCYEENKEGVREEFAGLAERLEREFAAEALYTQFVEATLGTQDTTLDIEALPKISLITSVYDAAEHIEQLLHDVTRQTIFKDRCEWLLYDVNPADKTAEQEIILKYAEKYPDNIIYKRLEEDPGIYGVWNQAIKDSTGEFVTNVNCDDRRAPWAFQEQASLLVSHPKIALAYTDSYVVHEPNVLYENIPPAAQRYNFEQFSQEAMLRGNLPHNNPMWRRSLHETHGYFDEKYRSAGDWEFWLRCTFNGEEFKKCADILGVYYFNPKGVSTNEDNKGWKQEEEKEVFKKYFKKMQQPPESNA